MKLSKRYKACLEDIEEFPHGYVVINCSSRIPNERLRVCTSFYCENGFPALYNWNKLRIQNVSVSFIEQLLLSIGCRDSEPTRYASDYGGS